MNEVIKCAYYSFLKYHMKIRFNNERWENYDDRILYWSNGFIPEIIYINKYGIK